MTDDRDVDYWENFYKKNAAPTKPTDFANYVMKKYAKKVQSLVELGCGNGRDAHFFAMKGLDVHAIDHAVEEIEKLIKTNGKFRNLLYAAADFTAMDDHDKLYDAVYSRFTLHSVSAEGQKKALEWSHRNLAPGGLLCIETRGKKNEIYKKGEPVPDEPDAYIFEDHYRRFVDFESFLDELKQLGFIILEASEQPGYAPFKGTDYHFIRVVAQK